MNLSSRRRVNFWLVLLSAIIITFGWWVAKCLAGYMITVRYYWDYEPFATACYGTFFLLLLVCPYQKWVADLPLGRLRGCGAIWLAAAVTVLYFAFYGLEKITIIPSGSYISEILDVSSIQALVVTFIALFIFRPVGEEIIFRGVLLNVFKSKRLWVLWIGTLITAWLFASMYGQYRHFSISVKYFILALLLTIARVRSNGLILPILLNAEAALMAVILES
ncbi:CPBP family intramembrane metalloprotease [Xenorhabdus bovienii]|uniref:CPBP family intramembrane glutamic endopeptidase n=1 Tax=Xenorhabdus bovienii TaxID=40576 RepID=UPI0023B2B510|nr:CPBP family intramembrane glutamic endopeptidase [Xenorhabdus bovienii]MDE9481220.1 CPBP family intramembrane metalloprotease [Xenorhabdus bovienii]MDE9542073.1 CPBP family intramembrane metalloprotease [Xenorhabdus bovienii]MDE9563639.1 CPBP family intramembrane metalloprotease [Xenorhabdus bovienii]